MPACGWPASWVTPCSRVSLLYRVHARYDADLEFARRMATQDPGYRIGRADEMPHDFARNGNRP